MNHCKSMPLQVGIEEGSRSMAVCVSGLQYCQYNQKKISLITLLSDLVSNDFRWQKRALTSLVTWTDAVKGNHRNMFFPELLLFTSRQLHIMFLWDYWSKILLPIKEQERTGQLKNRFLLDMMRSKPTYQLFFFCYRLPCPVSFTPFLPVPGDGYCWERGSLRSHRPTLLWWDTPIHCRAKHKTNQITDSWATTCTNIMGHRTA